MRLFLYGVLTILFIVPTLLLAQITIEPMATVTPSPPVPSATAPAFTTLPPSTPTMTPVASIPALAALEKITADNIDHLQPLFSLECHEPNTSLSSFAGIRNLLWSPARNLLAVVVYSGICLYDFDLNANEAMFIETYDTWSAVFSPDGEQLKVTLHNGNKSVRLWDTHTGREILTVLEAGYNIRRTSSVCIQPKWSVHRYGVLPRRAAVI